MLGTLLIYADNGTCGAYDGINRTFGALDRHRGGNVLVSERLIILVIGIALSIACELLARKTGGDRDLGVVFGLRHLEVLVADNVRSARLEQTPALRAHGVVAFELHRNDTRMPSSLIGAVAPIDPTGRGPCFTNTVCHLRSMKVAHYAIGALSVKDPLSKRRLCDLHVEELVLKLLLILRLNRIVKRLACSNLVVGLVGHRERDLDGRSVLAGLRTVDRALVAVKGNVIGAGGIRHLVVLTIHPERARSGHLQVVGQTVFGSNGIGVEVFNAVIRKGGVDLFLKIGLVCGDLFGIALDGNFVSGGTRKLHIGNVRQDFDF